MWHWTHLTTHPLSVSWSLRWARQWVLVTQWDPDPWGMLGIHRWHSGGHGCTTDWDCGEGGKVLEGPQGWVRFSKDVGAFWRGNGFQWRRLQYWEWGMVVLSDRPRVEGPGQQARARPCTLNQGPSLASASWWRWLDKAKEGLTWRWAQQVWWVCAEPGP